MTPARQPHYNTTDEDFDFIWKNISSPLIVRDRINVIKSRPHPAPAQGCCDIETIKPQPECFGNWKGIDSDCNCHIWGYCADVTIRARKAREQVLDALQRIADEKTFRNGKAKPCMMYRKDLVMFIESLRAQQQDHPSTKGGEHR
jgi:hypothetical protein